MMEVKSELRDQIQQLQFASDMLNSDSQVSQNSQPSTKKALAILFGKEENNPSVTLEEVILYFSESGAPTVRAIKKLTFHTVVRS